jgi:hypothetical protein
MEKKGDHGALGEFRSLRGMNGVILTVSVAAMSLYVMVVLTAFVLPQRYAG